MNTSDKLDRITRLAKLSLLSGNLEEKPTDITDFVKAAQTVRDVEPTQPDLSEKTDEEEPRRGDE